MSANPVLDAFIKRSEPLRLTQVPNGCWVACIAGLTRIPHDQLAALIPDVVDYDAKQSDYHNAVNSLMRRSGWRLAYIGPDSPRHFGVGTGTGPRGLLHSVIVFDGEVWHDPHPSRAGIEKLESFEVCIPISPVPNA